MVATVPSIKTLKTLPFKGGTRTFSNRYYFTGGTPVDDTHWHTLMDNIVATEMSVFNNDIVCVEALGYAPGSDVAVSSKVYSTVGGQTFGAGTDRYSGETAIVCRWSTAARSVKNHPIYCFKYLHGAWRSTSAAADLLLAAQRTLAQAYASSWVTGYSDGTVTGRKMSSPQGHTVTGSVVDEYVSHRDFPYTRSL